MDAIQDREPPRLKADVDSLKRELERVYQTVQGDPRRTTRADDSRIVCRGDGGPREVRRFARCRLSATHANSANTGL